MYIIGQLKNCYGVNKDGIDLDSEMQKRNTKRSPVPLGFTYHESHGIGEKLDNDINDSEPISKLIGMFDEYNYKYYLVLVSFTIFTSSILLVGIGLGIFYLISNGMCK